VDEVGRTKLIKRFDLGNGTSTVMSDKPPEVNFLKPEENY
jgi:hypothetical protein